MLNVVKEPGILGGGCALIKAFGTGSQWVNASQIAFNIIIYSMQNSRISKRSLIRGFLPYVKLNISKELRSLRSMVRPLPVRSLPTKAISFLTKSHFFHAQRTRNILGRLFGASWVVFYLHFNEHGAKSLQFGSDMAFSMAQSVLGWERPRGGGGGTPLNFG